MIECVSKKSSKLADTILHTLNERTMWVYIFPSRVAQCFPFKPFATMRNSHRELRFLQINREIFNDSEIRGYIYMLVSRCEFSITVTATFVTRSVKIYVPSKGISNEV